MKKINNAIELRRAIALLKVEEETKRTTLIDQFHIVYSNFRPFNLIKGFISNVIGLLPAIHPIAYATSGIKEDTTSEKVKRPGGILKRILVSIIQLAIANTITKKSELLISKSFGLINKLIK